MAQQFDAWQMANPQLWVGGQNNFDGLMAAGYGMPKQAKGVDPYQPGEPQQNMSFEAMLDRQRAIDNHNLYMQQQAAQTNDYLLGNGGTPLPEYAQLRGSMYGADSKLRGDVYGADTALQGDIYKADAAVRAAQEKGNGGFGNMTPQILQESQIWADKIHNNLATLKDIPGGNRPGSLQDTVARVYGMQYPDESLSDKIANTNYKRSVPVQNQIKVLQSIGPVMQRVYDAYKELGATQDGGPLDTLYNYGNYAYKNATGSPATAKLKQARLDLEREVLRGLTNVGAITDTAAKQFSDSLANASNLDQVRAVLDTIAVTANSRLDAMNKGQTGTADKLFGDISVKPLNYGGGADPYAPTQQSAPQQGRTVVRTGMHNGQRVVQYSDGTIDYQ